MRGSIFGYTVRLDTGKPVAGAKVTLSSAAALGPALEAMRSTNSAGWFTVDGLSAGQWQVTATDPVGRRGEASVSVFDNASTEVTIGLNGMKRWLAQILDRDEADEMADMRSTEDPQTASEPTRRISSEPIRTGSLRGRVVRGATGAPVADATIGVLLAAGPAPDIAPVSDADGYFTMDGLPWGTWELSAVDGEGRHGRAQVELRGIEVVEVVIRIGHGTARRHSTRA